MRPGHPDHPGAHSVSPPSERPASLSLSSSKLFTLIHDIQSAFFLASSALSARGILATKYLKENFFSDRSNGTYACTRRVFALLPSCVSRIRLISHRYCLTTLRFSCPITQLLERQAKRLNMAKTSELCFILPVNEWHRILGQMRCITHPT